MLEEVESVFAAAVRCDLDGGDAVSSGEGGIGSVVEEEFDDDEAVVSTERLVQCSESPARELVGVGSVFECELHSVFVVPVSFAEQKGIEAGLIELAALEKDFEDGVVVGFGDVVRSFFVVGIGSVVEEEPGEAGVVGDCGGTVDSALKDAARVGIVDGLVPAGGRVGTSGYEGFSGLEEGLGARFVEAQVTGEAEVGECVPLVWAAFGGGEGGVA